MQIICLKSQGTYEIPFKGSSAGSEKTSSTHQKQTHFYMITNELIETKITSTIPGTVTPKKTKYLGIHFAKHVQHLYAESCIMLLKEIKVYLSI